MNREKAMTFMKKSLRFLPDKAYINYIIGCELVEN